MPDNIGYYSQPSIHHNTIVFVSDDDLWSVPREGGIAKRLTANIGIAKQPKISPDGERIAYVGSDRGQMGLYLISADGGTPQQLTYFSVSNLIGWKDEETILFASGFQNFGITEVYEFDLISRSFKKLPYGEAVYISYGPNGEVMIGRKNKDSARWKRYKGGTAGVVWIRKNSRDKFHRILKEIKTHISSPHLVKDRVYFVSDHEGSANIYRCDFDGQELERLTSHEDYYVRNLEVDDDQLVYQKGADIYVYDLKTETESKIFIECPTPGIQAQARFEDAQHYLESYALSHDLQELFVGTRGHGFSMPVFDGPVMEWDLLRDVRYSHPVYSHDSRFLYLVGNNSQQSDRLIQCDLETRKMKILLPKNDWGVVRTISHSPNKDLLAIANNRCELYIVDTKTQKVKLVEKTAAFRSFDLTWSPKGRYLAYTTATESRQNFQIHIHDTKTGKTRMLLTPIVGDSSPSFSLDGQYLYFISVREFYPVYNATHFDLGFPFAAKPYVVSLTKSAPNPFKASVRNILLPVKNTEDKNTSTKKKSAPPQDEDIEIEFDGIDHRVMPFPLDLKAYEDIRAIPGGVLYRASEIRANQDFTNWSWESSFSLYAFKFEEGKEEKWVDNVESYKLCHQSQYMIYRTMNKSLRLVSSTAKPNKDYNVGKKDGWIELDRIRLQIHPREEWKQMYREAWYLQKEHFWRPDMSKIDWAETYNRYMPLLRRVKTRAEFSDLIWEMQGDLGTSHAYEMGGQYYRRPHYNILGLLGAEFEFQEKSKSFRISRIYQGDSWRPGGDSPLSAPGVQLQVGDEIHKVNGHGFQNALDLDARLQNQNDLEVQITVKRKGKKDLQNLNVKTLSYQSDLIYRDWVENNRRIVHEKSKGKLGYVHIPNMGPWGYAEFYRYFLSEFSHDGLIVDVRFNGGGHVSQHILKILAQKPMGVTETRHFNRSYYPAYAVRGPIVGITNEYAGSDGDIFSHSFKLLKLGKLVGKRTWGGVIGINSQYSLRDRTSVTQPEFSFWFDDVGWNVENYGTDPDIEVEYTPEDYQAKRDPQLLRAIEEGLEQLKIKPAFNPMIKDYPNLAAPGLLKKPEGVKAPTKRRGRS